MPRPQPMALLTIKPTQVDIEIASKVADHTDVAIAVSLNLLQAWKTGGAAVDEFALAFTPSFADDVCSPDTSKNASKSDGCGEFYRCVQCDAEISRENRNRTSSLSYCYYLSFFRGAPGR